MALIVVALQETKNRSINLQNPLLSVGVLNTVKPQQWAEEKL